ncbi:MAG: hypothetical protein JWO86_2493 [Myxococcaceae bacterium]|nr:hypothetical protein [Myxococcaceae bacterium]
MRRITTAILLGAAAAVALAPLLACEDDTTVNTAFKDAGAGEGGEGGEAGHDGEAGASNEAGAATDAADGG